MFSHRDHHSLLVEKTKHSSNDSHNVKRNFQRLFLIHIKLSSKRLRYSFDARGDISLLVQWEQGSEIIQLWSLANRLWGWGRGEGGFTAAPTNFAAVANSDLELLQLERGCTPEREGPINVARVLDARESCWTCTLLIEVVTGCVCWINECYIYYKYRLRYTLYAGF